MANRLASAHSLYLRKHAENPIDWWPWGDEALAVAKRDDKPIFLSIGYSSCHWCTVMEGEAFSDGAIATYMNAHFLPIKVDREERPDLDSIYMQALQMMVGQGGWPLNIFIDPTDLVPFYGGTYFPIEPRYGRPGFLQILHAIREFYDTDKEKLVAVRGEILSRLSQSASLDLGAVGVDLSADLLLHGLRYSLQILASTHPGPRFPMIPHAEVALRGQRLQVDPVAADPSLCLQRGLDLALGGIFDHVAGGFHRYAVDPTWTVPHFEKMLYDNGQIVEYLANLWSAGMREPAFERAIAHTIQWLRREMTAPQGYFYAAQDADSFTTPNDPEPEEGAFYVWAYSELEALLSPAQLAALRADFAVTPAGNFEGAIVLQRHRGGVLSGDSEAALKPLFVARYGEIPEALASFPPARTNAEAKALPWPGRIPAVTDPKMIVAWNALMISGLARAAVVFQQPDYLTLADNAAQFILTHQIQAGRLHRLNYEGTVSTIARSEDYAFFLKALLDLHQAHQLGSGQPLSERLSIQPNFHSPAYWLGHALKLQAEFDEHLWTTEMGGYYNTDASPDLVVRERSFEDNATPSANGVAIANLVRLFLLTEDLAYLTRAEQALQSFGTLLEKAPGSCPGLFAALDWLHHPTLVKTTTAAFAAIRQGYWPTAIFRRAEDLPAHTVGLVCQGLSCQEPAQSLTQLQAQLTSSTHAPQPPAP